MHPACIPSKSGLSNSAAILLYSLWKLDPLFKRLYETCAHPKKRQVSLTHTSTIQETVLEISRQFKRHETGTETRTLIYNAVKCWTIL